MTITEITLRRWRKEALRLRELELDSKPNLSNKLELYERILRMTQELLDQHLLRK